MVKHNTLTLMGHDTSIFKRKVYSCTCTHKEKRNKQLYDASQGLGRQEQSKSETNRRKETMKIRVEINEIET